MSFDRKVNAFYSLYKLRFPDEAEDPNLKRVINDLFAVQDRRNEMLHSAWAFSEDGEIVSRAKSSARAKRSHGLRTQMSSANPQDVEAVAQQINDAGQQFGIFMKQRIQDRLIPAKPAG